MSRASVVILLAMLVAVAGGLAYLATWDIPPPSAPVEQTIPNDRFPR